MAGNMADVSPAEHQPAGTGPAPYADGRKWGITSKATPGTYGVGGNATANGKGSDFKC